MVDEQGAYCTMGIGVIPCTPHAIRDALLDMNIAHHIDELLEEGMSLLGAFLEEWANGSQ